MRSYRVFHLLWDLGWDDLNLNVPQCCLAAQPLLPNSHQPQQNWADSGTHKIQVNLAQVSQPLKFPILLYQAEERLCSKYHWRTLQATMWWTGGDTSAAARRWTAPASSSSGRPPSSSHQLRYEAACVDWQFLIVPKDRTLRQNQLGHTKWVEKVKNYLPYLPKWRSTQPEMEIHVRMDIKLQFVPDKNDLSLYADYVITDQN